MRRRDDAHVAANGLVAADALEAAFLQHPQQLDLHLQRHVADFVEEQRAAFGKLEAAQPRGQRAGEGALFVSEQFAFQQVGGNGAAIHRHERMSRAARQFVNVARHHFLAGAGLAENQHVGIERRDLLDEPMHRAHRARGAARAKAMRSRLRRVTVAHVLRLIQNGRQAALLDGQLQMKPRQIAAALGDFRQSVVAQADDGQRLSAWRAAASRIQTLRAATVSVADDHGQAILRLGARAVGAIPPGRGRGPAPDPKNAAVSGGYGPPNLRVRSQ